MKKENWYKPYHSSEEAYTSWYLDELAETGYVLKYEHQPSSIKLSSKATYPWQKTMKTKIKSMRSTLLQEHVYTPDFKVTWDKDAYGIFFKDKEAVLNNNDCYFWAETCFVENVWDSYLEVKPTFDRNNMIRLFSINQKWLYHEYGLYVQKIIPVKLFMDTFTPQRYRQTDMGKQGRKLLYYPKTLKGYLDKQAENKIEKIRNIVRDDE